MIYIYHYGINYCCFSFCGSYWKYSIRTHFKRIFVWRHWQTVTKKKFVSITRSTIVDYTDMPNNESNYFRCLESFFTDCNDFQIEDFWNMYKHCYEPFQVVVVTTNMNICINGLTGKEWNQHTTKPESYNFNMHESLLLYIQINNLGLQNLSSNRTC